MRSAVRGRCSCRNVRTTARRRPRSPPGHSEHTASGETAGETSSETSTPVPSSEVHAETTGERVLGINTETNTIINLVVVVSVRLAGAVLLAPRFSWLVWAAVVFCLAAAAFDVAEIVHQLSRSEPGFATLAALIAVVHLGTAALGVEIERRHA